MTTNRPTKVVIEITAGGWSERVYAEEVVIAETVHVMESRRSALSSDSKEWCDRLPDDLDALAEGLDDLSFGPFKIAGALYELEEECDTLVEALESAKSLIANHSGEKLLDEYAGDQIEHIDAALAATQPVEQQDNVPDGWRSRFLKLMGEIQSELDGSDDDPIPSELWSLWRELLDTAPQPAERQPEWQPIETAPADTEILVMAGGYIGKAIFLTSEGEWYLVSYYGEWEPMDEQQVSLWMPLPEEPE